MIARIVVVVIVVTSGSGRIGIEGIHSRTFVHPVEMISLWTALTALYLLATDQIDAQDVTPKL